MSVAEVLRRITAALDRAGITYMLTGSFASAHYGALRSTMDIDIVVAADRDRLRLLARYLPGSEYYIDLDAALAACERESMFNVIDLKSGWKVDLIFRKSRAFSQEEFSRRKLVKVEGLPIFIASPEDVVIAKLEWSRLAQSQRQIEDVGTILKVQWGSIDRAYISHWVTDLDLTSEWLKARKLAAIPEEQ